MLIFFGILIVIACILLGFFVLVQNPKGGGLAGNLGGFGNQVMGVRQTTDVLEKGTWILAAVIAVLCLTSTMFIGGGNSSNGSMPQSASERAQGAVPATNSVTLPGTGTAQPQQQQSAQPAPAAADSAK